MDCMIVCPFGSSTRVCLEVFMQGEASRGVLGSVLSFLQPALRGGGACAEAERKVRHVLASV